MKDTKLTSDLSNKFVVLLRCIQWTESTKLYPINWDRKYEVQISTLLSTNGYRLL